MAGDLCVSTHTAASRTVSSSSCPGFTEKLECSGSEGPWGRCEPAVLQAGRLESARLLTLQQEAPVAVSGSSASVGDSGRLGLGSAHPGRPPSWLRFFLQAGTAGRRLPHCFLPRVRGQPDALSAAEFSLPEPASHCHPRPGGALPPAISPSTPPCQDHLSLLLLHADINRGVPSAPVHLVTSVHTPGE